jgi:hypothetical protein
MMFELILIDNRLQGLDQCYSYLLFYLFLTYFCLRLPSITLKHTRAW